MIAIEIPAAMRPYSMAVAPDSSRQKDMNCDMESSLTVAHTNDGGVPPPAFFYAWAVNIRLLGTFNFVEITSAFAPGHRNRNRRRGILKRKGSGDDRSLPYNVEDEALI
jgi:hypothetical protein